ncbi:UBC-like protein [Aspergillus campestris IBT 28561]|uniref:UBC-like protein n=1 Tax=Aspergillus campestris (strain IBT 28561) TaxID=1392248 RepID=A0A2I1D6T8_ASPC2|nr:UBC-like protein [Aspergillus campestris IBT 28561]PKY05569.1 UBC-like protein [Aspergillus campestris IBT 28561]
MSAPLRRLMKEAAELNASPSPHFHAAPISDSNLFEWHFTLAGPPAPSAYAGGIYHGRIVLPPTYPLRPPSFRFLTPSGRFEVNREICLSISGHHEELWQPAWGIRTSLLAIRSFMDADAMGQVGGMDASREARREYAGRSGDYGYERGASAAPTKWCRGDGERRTSLLYELNPSSHHIYSPSESRLSTTFFIFICTTPAATPITPGFPPAQTPASPLQAAAAAPPPVPATATQAHSGSAAASQTNSNSTPWLDRAIFGLFIALLVMILRRIARDE